MSTISEGALSLLKRLEGAAQTPQGMRSIEKWDAASREELERCGLIRPGYVSYNSFDATITLEGLAVLKRSTPFRRISAWLIQKFKDTSWQVWLLFIGFIFTSFCTWLIA